LRSGTPTELRALADMVIMSVSLDESARRQTTSNLLRRDDELGLSA
jgi:hypothetical protein